REALEDPGPDVLQDVVQVERVVRDASRTVSEVEVAQAVDLLPERTLVHAVLLEQRGLHVARDERLVEVPDDGDHRLAERSWHVTPGAGWGAPCQRRVQSTDAGQPRRMARWSGQASSRPAACASAASPSSASSVSADSWSSPITRLTPASA